MKTLQEKITKYEDTLVGMMLMSPDIILSTSFDLLIFKKWRLVVAEIFRQINNGIRPDMVSISDAFPDNKLMLSELWMLVKDCPSSANYTTYLSLLAEKVNDSQILLNLQKAIKEISEGVPVKETIMPVINNCLLSANGLSEKTHDYSSDTLWKLFVDRLEDSYDKKSSKHDKFKTGIEKLDRVIGYFQPTDLIVIGARPAQGKTAWAVSVILNMINVGKNIGFISTEMSAEQISYRLASQLTGIPARNYRECDFEDHHWNVITNAISEIKNKKLRIYDKPEITISELTMKCRAWDMVEKLDAVFIDYLTRIKPDQMQGSRTLDVGDIATQCKNLARNLNIPVFVLAQLNRGSAMRQDKTPTMADLRDSGIIEQEADCVLLLHREETETHTTNHIIVEKNRHGESFADLIVDFDGRIMRWS